MKELLELLKEYSSLEFEHGEGFFTAVDTYGNVVYLPEAVLISKQYGFIEWLVKNDCINYVFKKHLDKKWFLGETVLINELLKELAIQDKPIKYLIAVLK